MIQLEQSVFTALPFEPKWLENIAINVNSVRFKANACSNTVKTEDFKQKHWTDFCIIAIESIDLTTLGGDDSESNVERLCWTAKNPLNSDNMEDLNFPIVAAVCVYPTFLKTVRDTLDRLATSSSRKVEIAVVSTGFPTGQCGSLSLRCQEIEWAVENLATEVDVVILRSLVIQGKWRELYEEIAAMRKACGQNVKLKVIVEVGELGSLENVFKASMVAMNAGADFIKTSTGKATVNATLMFGIVMLRAIWWFRSLTGRSVGFKAAGGIKTANDAVRWVHLVRSELGENWVNPSLFRIGASSLLSELAQELRP